MKKIYYLLAFLLLGLGSCNEFLETEPADFLAPSTYFNTEADINYARAGVYHHLGAGGLWGSAGNYTLGFSADEGYMNRANLPVGTWNSNHTTADGTVLSFYTNLYGGINRANVLLANLDNNTAVKQEFRDRVRGEILFLRGYYYFMLVQNFGGVPLKLTPTNSVIEVDQPRASTREVYDQILKDMEAAEPLVHDIRTIGFGGQVSKSAVRGLLARVNLYMAGHPLKDATRYEEARKWAKMVMDDATAGHDLNPSYANIFINLAADRYEIKESIWEVEFQGNRLDQYVETGNNGWNNGPGSPTGSATGGGLAYVNTTASVFQVYEPGDLRKFWNMNYFTYTNTNVVGSKNMVAEPSTVANMFIRFPAKYRREYETLFPKSQTNTPINVPLLRFSDVLLMYAEAENEINGPTPEVLEIVNRIRLRSFAVGGIKTLTVKTRGSNYTSAPTITFTGGGGTGARATATRGAVSSNRNQIVALTLNRDSTGVTFARTGKYTSAPTVTITGGGGSGATAEATIFTEADVLVKSPHTDSKENFRAFLQDERMREFAFENLRKPDLIRWGIFVETMQNVANTWKAVSSDERVRAYANVELKHLLFPIPANEMNTNLNMVQNPGW